MKQLMKQMFDPYVALASVEEDLKEKDITLVEYGEILTARFGYPVCIQTIKWAIPDSQLAAASAVLLEHEIPVVGSPELLADLYGEWETVGIMHRHANMRVHLVPLSYTLLSLDDCYEVLSGVSRERNILIPKPRPYLISLLCKVMRLPLKMRERRIISINITIFLGHVVFPQLPDDEDEEDESEEHFQQRVEKALSFVRQWEWRLEEKKYLDITEKTIRDCSYIRTLSE